MSALPAIRWLSLFADVRAERIEPEMAFWAGVTGTTPGHPSGGRGEFIPLVPPEGDRYVWLQRIEEGFGGWHLDLHVDDVTGGSRVAVAAGARLVRADPGLATLTSPTGQPFCLVSETRPRRIRPPVPSWKNGRSLVDQICFDIPAASFDTECEFWSELTGWPRVHGSRPEFDRLELQPQLPLRVLLQRLEQDDTEGIRAHADLSADDRLAEVGRHLDLGATDEQPFGHWTTLTDPAGLRYCVTDRTPLPN